MLERCWRGAGESGRGAGEVLERCLRVAGEVLERCWRGVGETKS